MTKDELLILLIEECSEVIKAATKCLRFGYSSDHGLGYGRNDLILAKEVGETVAIIDALELDKEEFMNGFSEKISRAEENKKKYGV